MLKARTYCSNFKFGSKLKMSYRLLIICELYGHFPSATNSMYLRIVVSLCVNTFRPTTLSLTFFGRVPSLASLMFRSKCSTAISSSFVALISEIT